MGGKCRKLTSAGMLPFLSLKSVSDMKPRTGRARQIVEGSFQRKVFGGKLSQVLTKDSPSGQVVGVVPFDAVEQVLERCCILPISDPNAQHDRLVERVEPLWASEDVCGGLLQIESDVRVSLAVDHFQVGCVLQHDLMEAFF